MATATQRRWLQRQNSSVRARGNAMSEVMFRWMQRYAARAATEAASNIRGKKPGQMRAAAARTHVITKADDPTADFGRMEKELYDILQKYGLAQLNSAGKRAGGLVGAKWVLRPQIKRQMLANAAAKVKLIANETESMIRGSLKQVLDQAMSEDPIPSSQEIARRIARQWHGPPQRAAARGRGRGPAERRAEERGYLFSFERAELIARTELAVAENEGIKRGFEDSGVDKVKWLAHSDDGRSGEREHYKMNRHKAITVVEMNGSNKSKWFKLPDGTRMRYPGWSGGPIGHLANCRCTLIPA